MTELILNAIYVGIFLTIMAEIPLIIFLCWFWQYGKRKYVNELAYEKLYKEIQQDITDMPTISGCYNIILNKLITLGTMKWHDEKRTTRLTDEFYTKHVKERLRRAIA